MISGIQNGAPYGLALCYGSHVISGQFLSYEGTIVATNGPAIGITSTDIGVSESSTTPVGKSLQLIGNGTKYSDFTWGGPYTSTFGSVNSNGTTDQSLPVSLTTFTAQPSGNSVALTWRTESEIENMGFILERRQEAGEWKQVASYTTDETLQGHGSTTEAHEYSYTDAAVVPGATYFYRLGDVDYSGKVIWHKEVEVKVEVEAGEMAEGFHLGALYPNPFNATFTIPLTLKESLPVQIYMYDMNGKVVRSILNRQVSAGEYRLKTDTGDLSSGVYFVRITIGNSARVEKIVLMK